MSPASILGVRPLAWRGRYARFAAGGWKADADESNHIGARRCGERSDARVTKETVSNIYATTRPKQLDCERGTQPLTSLCSPAALLRICRRCPRAKPPRIYFTLPCVPPAHGRAPPASQQACSP
eukprot:scaffold90398_cov57-Phaeocystis_antarctica.AAC.5